MASLRGRSRSSAESEIDRGQFLLIGAFGLAVLLIVMAGVANTVTYTSAITTHDDQYPTSRDVSAFQEDARRGVEGIIARVNDGSGDHETKVDRFVASVEHLESGTDREHLTDGTGVAITVEGTTNESRITQSAERKLTDATDDGDWTLARDIQETRRFELRLNKSSLTDGSCSRGCFELVLDEEKVTVSQSEVAGECSIERSVDTVSIDVVEGTVNGEQCDAVDVTEGATTPYEIRYRNGENATGTYQLTVREATIEESTYTGEDSLSVTHVIYTAKIAVRYHHPQLTYTNEDIEISEDDPYA